MTEKLDACAKALSYSILLNCRDSMLLVQVILMVQLGLDTCQAIYIIKIIQTGIEAVISGFCSVDLYICLNNSL